MRTFYIQAASAHTIQRKVVRSVVDKTVVVTKKLGVERNLFEGQFFRQIWQVNQF